ncbi:hypothetical protein LRR81_18805 [Metabacillus sp. GX 13764]|uniref:hypothetical protein n=1 Tax=Metabacillus kandeliae TaxID=2900151 RepID=UPI001E2A4357|nr:hypothetical protein [Metabacillus kandeliae]MCD7036299.1 hypothetical protein [Metabacillus kandeliae]
MQQQNSQNQQGTMQQPPDMISTKDHLYITDMLTWNLLAMKKAHFYAGQCQNQELADGLTQAGEMHSRHYQQILQLLQNGNQQQIQ